MNIDLKYNNADKSNNINKGFTLVELIVVLVILAILAAILVPALLGYIDEAKKKQDAITAKSLLTAVQSELTKCYGKYKADGTSSQTNIFGENIKYFPNSVDPNLSDSKFKDRVFELAGIEETPYLVMFYTKKFTDDKNSNLSNSSSELHDYFTAISLVYWSKKGAKPIYYDFDTNSWEEGSLYTAEIMYRGNASSAIKNKYPGYDKNQILKGHKYDGTRVIIYVLYNGTGKKNIKDINDLIENEFK